MKFVSLDDVKLLLPVTFRETLELDAPLFEAIENAAAIMIRDESGLEFTNGTDTPDWVRTVAAWFIAYLTVEQFTTIDEVLSKRIENNLKLGKSICAEKRNTIVNAESGTTRFDAVVPINQWS